MISKRKILFTSHTANFQKFNRPIMRMLRGTLANPYKDLNMGSWQVDYACANDEEVHDADNVFVVDFARNPFRFDKHLKAYKQLKSIISKNNYEIIHTHTPVGSVITRLAAKDARRKGTKVIYTCHGFQFYKGGPKKDWKLYYPIEKKLSRSTDLIITINTEDFALAKSSFDCRAKMIDGVGIDLSKYTQKYSEDELIAARKQYEFKEDDFIVVYIAEFIKRKNHARLIKAAAPLIKKNKKIKLLFLGQGKLMNETRSLAKELGISKNIITPGYIRENFAQLLHSCNLGISTSFQEGLGLGVLECVASGLPIIIADTRGHRDIVDNNKKYLFDPFDEDSISQKLSDAIAYPPKYRLSFPKRYSLRNSLSEMKEIYESIMDKS